MLAGVWLVVAPWLLGFDDIAAAVPHVALGILLALLSAFELWMLRNTPIKPA